MVLVSEVVEPVVGVGFGRDPLYGWDAVRIKGVELPVGAAFVRGLFSGWADELWAPSRGGSGSISGIVLKVLS